MTDIMSITQAEPNLLKKKYEEMSLEEMSQHMEESNRQISEMLSSTSSSVSTTGTIETTTEVLVSEQDEYTTLFTRLASNGDTEKLRKLLSDPDIRGLIDMNARDNEGTPPLIYAACFGKIEVAQILIEFGANIDAQDSCKLDI